MYWPTGNSIYGHMVSNAYLSPHVLESTNRFIVSCYYQKSNYNATSYIMLYAIEKINLYIFFKLMRLC